MTKNPGKDSQPLVSVIMNCYNGEKYLSEAIDSIYTQTYNNWEIIFWDNASTDRSADIAKSYDSKLRYFRGEETIPLGSARNKALEMCRGKFIAFLDCDDLWMPGKLEKQIPLFQDPEVGLVFCDGVYFNEFGQSKIFYSSQPYAVGWCFSMLLSQYFLSMPTTVIRRSALDSLDYWFDPRFQISEEADLFRRIGYSWKLAMSKDILAKWRVHESSWTWTKYNLVPQEVSLMLAEYSRIFPRFRKRFAKEISDLNMQIRIDGAFQLLREGNSSKARKNLSPYKMLNKKAFIFYMMTILPRNLLLLIFRLKGNVLPKDSIYA